MAETEMTPKQQYIWYVRHESRVIWKVWRQCWQRSETIPVSLMATLVENMKAVETDLLAYFEADQRKPDGLADTEILEAIRYGLREA